MQITPISELQLRRLDYTICVRVSRMWEFHGQNEQNEIKHLDLVLIDQKVCILLDVQIFITPFFNKSFFDI